MAAPRNARDLFGKIATSAPPTNRVIPPFPRIPEDIVAANPKLAEAWRIWQKQIDDWTTQIQVIGILPS